MFTTHLYCGLNEVQARLLGEIVNLLLKIQPQLLHQLEGVHVCGTGVRDMVRYFHCKNTTARKFRGRSKTHLYVNAILYKYDPLSACHCGGVTINHICNLI